MSDDKDVQVVREVMPKVTTVEAVRAAWKENMLTISLRATNDFYRIPVRVQQSEPVKRQG